MARREDTLAKLMTHIEAAKQKADKTLISEIPPDLCLGKYTEDAKEEGCAEKEEIPRYKPKGKAIHIENGILRRAWW